MRVVSALVLIFVFFTGVEFVQAQNRANVWYLGDRAGIDFNQTPPAPLLDSPERTVEGCATICDPATGDLLMYTNGYHIFNADGNIMENGEGIHFWPCNRSAMQGALIVPVPENPDGYYVFTSDCFEANVQDAGVGNGTRVATVDMSANGGLGRVTELRRKLTDQSTEQISGVQHCNNRDYWVATREYGNLTINMHLVSPKGIEANKVVNIGLVPANNFPGVLKFSSNGDWLVSTTYSVDAGVVPGTAVELYRFDRRTGLLSDGIILEQDLAITGAEFSPDNSKLYINMRDGSGGRITLFQYDLAAGSAQDIKNSGTAISDSQLSGSGLGVMQLAPNGWIFVSALLSTDILGYIPNPNDPAASVVLNLPGSPEGFDLQNRQVAISMPNFVCSFLGDNELSPAECPLPERSQFSVSDNNFCPGECIDFTDESIGAEYWLWSFEGGTPDMSTDASPQGICFNTPGTYTVRQCVGNGNGEVFSEQTITVRGDCSVPTAQFTVDRSSICAGECVAISNTTIGATSYEWDFTGASNITASTDQFPPNVCYDTPGTYTIQLRALNDVGSNSASVLIEVTDCPTVVADFSVDRTQICRGECISITNTSQSADSYNWVFNGGNPGGSTDRDPGSVCYPNAGTYTILLTASNDFGSDAESIDITVLDDNVLTASLPNGLEAGLNSEIEIPVTITVNEPNTVIQIPALLLELQADSRLLDFTGAEGVNAFAAKSEGSVLSAALEFTNLTLNSGANEVAVVRARTLHGRPETTTDLQLFLGDLEADDCISLAFSDGSFTQTNVCSDQEVQLASNSFGIVNVSPNPSDSDVRVGVQSEVPGTHTLELISVWGERLAGKSWESRPAAGQVLAQNVRFDVAGLPAGVYLLRLRTAAGSATERIVVGR